jgi:hypothetical protein
MLYDFQPTLPTFLHTKIFSLQDYSSIFMHWQLAFLNYQCAFYCQATESSIQKILEKTFCQITMINPYLRHLIDVTDEKTKKARIMNLLY